MNQKTVFITGASSGIGYALAKEFATRGYKVYCGARRLDRMKPLEQLGIQIIELDVTDNKSIHRALEFIREDTGGYLDILFNNAGSQCKLPAIDITDEKLEKCFRTNVFGAIKVTREFAPLVIKSKGIIAFVGSTSAVNPFPFASIYSATKGAIHAFASSFAIEMIPFDVKVVNVITGGVSTEIGDNTPLPQTSLYRIDGVNMLSAKVTGKDTRVSPSQYAKRVVNDIQKVKKSTSNLVVTCRGSDASWHYWVSLLYPRWYIERKIVSMFGFREILRRLKEYYG